MKRVPVFLLLFFPALFFTTAGCRHEPFLPDRLISFSGDVLPIIGGNCQQSGCHDQGSGRKLIQYDDFLKSDRIVPDNPYKSEIYTRIVTQRSGNVMPVPPRSPLTNQQIQMIFTWIKQGAKNN